MSAYKLRKTKHIKMKFPSAQNYYNGNEQVAVDDVRWKSTLRNTRPTLCEPVALFCGMSHHQSDLTVVNYHFDDSSTVCVSKDKKMGRGSSEVTEVEYFCHHQTPVLPTWPRLSRKPFNRKFHVNEDLRSTQRELPKNVHFWRLSRIREPP